jgi:ABC-type antimicrobial peptide transport system permease subunit
MSGKADPVVFFCFPAYATVMYVRIKPTTASVVAENESGSGLEQALAKIEGVMKKDNAGYPFDYRFVDDEFNSQFMNEMLIGKLSRLFATLAIFISCLGLFGLAAHTAERRTKEIGIRKVLGASVPGIAGLLSKDFLKLIVLSAVIAFPLAWWFMNKWLQGYQYRITIDWTLFVLAGSLAIAIALITISFQAIRAALGNPVAALRSE